MSRRQCSSTFRPALALIGVGVGNRPFPSMPTSAVVRHISERKRGPQLSAPAQSDSGMVCTGRSARAKPPRKYDQIRGYVCHQPPYNPRIPVFKALRDCAALSRHLPPIGRLRLESCCQRSQEGQIAQVPANWPFLRILAQSRFVCLLPLWHKAISPRLAEGLKALPTGHSSTRE